MRAWKCDRCGKLFAALPNNKKLNDITVSYLSYGNKDFSRLAELCESCIDEFILWFKEPALAAITNEGE